MKKDYKRIRVLEFRKHLQNQNQSFNLFNSKYSLTFACLEGSII